MTISSVLYEWQTFGHRYRLCRADTRIEGWKALSAPDARWVLRTLLEATHTTQLSLSAVLGRDRSGLPSNLGDPGVLEREVQHRRLTVLEQPISQRFPVGAPAARPPEAEPWASEPRRERAWIDITVVDDSVPPRPLSGVRFALGLPDRSRHEGVLDSEGHLRVDDIDPGKCFLELTDLRTGLKA